ncbi:Pycsar system effector family protein [Streptomyces sp. LE64]|uniref:Pycsar system effector family protein n=1 Tax=Streptomyces sp. LE64 TaxID=3448653 RepID=UPI0040429D7F
MSATNRITAAHAEVKAEIARTDTKTGLLLAFVGALLAGAWTVGKDLPLTVPAAVLGGLGIAVLIAAVAMLLRSVRPNLGGDRPCGFPYWATLSAEQLRTELSEDYAEDVAGLSRIAVAKFTALKHAVDLTYTGGALLVLAALFTIGGVA